MGSPSVSPTSSMVDWTDSFYNYVKERVLAVNESRVFSGIVEASDWPSSEVVLESFYLVRQSISPNRPDSPGGNSWSSPLYGEPVQWSWPIMGDDIQPTNIAANRGDRYRKNFAMMQEILQGMFPGFCEKKQFSIDVTGELLSTSYDPKEYIWFTKPVFATKIDKSTGFLFGTASTTITGFAPTILS